MVHPACLLCPPAHMAVAVGMRPPRQADPEGQWTLAQSRAPRQCLPGLSMRRQPLTMWFLFLISQAPLTFLCLFIYALTNGHPGAFLALLSA